MVLRILLDALRTGRIVRPLETLEPQSFSQNKVAVTWVDPLISSWVTRIVSCSKSSQGEEFENGDEEAQNVLTNGKVSNVGQQVKNSHKDDCRVGRILNGPNRVFNFIGHIERIRIASIGEDNVHQSVWQTVSVIGRALEGIAEVGSRVRDNFEVAAEGDETRDDDNNEGDDLGDTEDVRETEWDVGA